MGKITKYKLKRIIDSDIESKQIAEMLRMGVADEYDAIRKYESYYNEVVLKQTESGKDYSKVLKCLQDVIDEEKKHVGEFNEMVKIIAPEEYELYEEGKKEVIKIIKNN